MSANATIIDVRTKYEFSGERLDTAINIPLHHLEAHIPILRKLNKPVVVCCNKGMRSRVAKEILSQHNIEAVNAGSYSNLLKTASSEQSIDFT